MPLSDFALERFFAKYEFSAKYLLCSSDCETISIKELFDLTGKTDILTEQLLKLRLGYTESLGDPELRDEISKLYSSTTKENIIVFAGAEEGVFSFMNALLSKQDHVIVQWPCYQSLYEVARENAQVSKWETSFENNWELDLEILKQMIRPQTKVIVINCPHNPTGYQINVENYKKLMKIAEENGILVFSDEVYKYLEHDSKNRLPAACDIYSNGFSLGVLSKSFGLAGLRIGWIASQNKEALRAIASQKDYTSLCNSAPSEFLAKVALREKEKLWKNSISIIESNLKLLDQFFEKWKRVFAWKKPIAGPVAFPKLLIDVDIDTFCEELVQKKGVLLLPSSCYQFGNKHFRLGFGRKNLPEALNKLEEFLIEEKY